MLLKESEFKLIDRGFKEVILFLPGWATDYRIFATLDLNYNYLYPAILNPFNFNNQLSRFLDKESIEKISLFGWSQGGFLAVEFTLGNLERVDRLILLNICKKFNPERLEAVRQKLTKNKTAYLYKFYLDCFAKSDKEGFAWFKNNLLKDYLSNMQIEDLLLGLDYLAQASIEPELLRGVQRLAIFHGAEDRIASLDESLQIKSCLPQANFVSLPDSGHISFLNQSFREELTYE